MGENLELTDSGFSYSRHRTSKPKQYSRKIHEVDETKDLIVTVEKKDDSDTSKEVIFILQFHI